MDGAGFEGVDGGDTGEEGLTAACGADTEDDGSGGVDEVGNVDLLVGGAGSVGGFVVCLILTFGLRLRLIFISGRGLDIRCHGGERIVIEAGHGGFHT